MKRTLILAAASSGTVMAIAAVFWPTPEGASATSIILACDPSGESFADVCRPELNLALGRQWVNDALDAPGTHYEVVHAAGTFSETRIESPIIAPGTWGAEPQVTIKRWQNDVDTVLSEMNIKPDPNERHNHSDLISLLAVSARRAAEIPAGGVELIVATDGRLVSLGFDAEKRVPGADAVLARMGASGVHVDMSVFSAITVCGLHNQGTDAASADALAALWRGLVTGLGGPSPTVLTTCRTLEAAGGLASASEMAP